MGARSTDWCGGQTVRASTPFRFVAGNHYGGDRPDGVARHPVLAELADLLAYAGGGHGRESDDSERVVAGAGSGGDRCGAGRNRQRGAPTPRWQVHVIALQRRTTPWCGGGHERPRALLPQPGGRAPMLCSGLNRSGQHGVVRQPALDRPERSERVAPGVANAELDGNTEHDRHCH